MNRFTLRERKRRVIFCSPGLGDRGGAARRAELLTSELARRGWDVVVLARSSRFLAFRCKRSGGRLVLEIPSLGLGRLSAPLYLLYGLAAGLVTGWRASVVVGLQFNSPSILAGMIAGLARRPLMLMATSDGAHDVEGLLFGSAFLQRLWFRHVRSVAAQTDEAAAELRKAFPKAEVWVLRNPVALEARGSSSPAQHVVSRSSVCLYLGRFEPVKNLNALLDAWRDVTADTPQHRLRLVGGFVKGDQTPELEWRLKMEPALSASVDLLPWTDDPSSEFARAAMLVLPSRVEGVSNVLLEACSYGLPIVASNISGNRLVLGDNYPMLVDPADSESLAACMRAILDSPRLRTELSAVTRSRVERFSPAAVAFDLEQAFLRM